MRKQFTEYSCEQGSPLPEDIVNECDNTLGIYPFIYEPFFYEKDIPVTKTKFQFLPHHNVLKKGERHVDLDLTVGQYAHSLDYFTPGEQLTLRWKNTDTKAHSLKVGVMSFRGFDEHCTGKKNKSDTKNKAKSKPSDVKMYFNTYTTECIFWDEEAGVWKNNGCNVGVNASNIFCNCTHLSTFASRFIKPPNKLDITKIEEYAKRISNNPVSVAFVGALWVTYFLLLLWARYKDADDEEKLTVHQLVDNDPNHNYYYIITFLTGWKVGGGTTSIPSFRLVGSKELSSVHVAYQTSHSVFNAGGEDTFLLATADYLGEIDECEIWISCSGTFPSWYLNQVAIKDLQTGQDYQFICNSWFDPMNYAVYKCLSRVHHIDEFRYKYRFAVGFQRNLRDNHLWLSIFMRPKFSDFSRSQRITCALSFVSLCMVVSMMWYQSSAGGKKGNISPLIMVGNTIDINWNQIFIGIMAGLICIPVNLVIITFFKCAKKRPVGRTAQAANNSQVQPISDDDAEKSRCSRYITSCKPRVRRKNRLLESCEKLSNKMSQFSYKRMVSPIPSDQAAGPSSTATEQPSTSTADTKHTASNVQVLMPMTAMKNKGNNNSNINFNNSDKNNSNDSKDSEKESSQPANTQLRNSLSLFSRISRSQFSYKRMVSPTSLDQAEGPSMKNKGNNNSNINFNNSDKNNNNDSKDSEKESSQPANTQLENSHSANNQPGNNPSASNQPEYPQSAIAPSESNSIAELTELINACSDMQEHRPSLKKFPEMDRGRRMSVAFDDSAMLFGRVAPRRESDAASMVSDVLSSKQKGEFDNYFSRTSRTASMPDRPESRGAAQYLKAVAEEQETKKTRSLTKVLPWWFVYVAYVLAITTSLISSFFIIFYGLSFGKEKSTAWVVSFFTSFFQDLGVLQPCKVVIVTAIVCAVVKAPIKPAVSTYSKYVHTDRYHRETLDAIQSKLTDEEIKVLMRATAIPELKIVNQVRQKLDKDSHIRTILFDGLIYIAFMVVTFYMVNGQYHPFTHLQDKAVKNFILSSPHVDTISFFQVHSLPELWAFVQTTLVPGTLYAGAAHPAYRSYLVDMANVMVGMPRLRQVRHVPGECDHRWTGNVHCRTWGKVDTGAYPVGWGKNKWAEENDGNMTQASNDSSIQSTSNFTSSPSAWRYASGYQLLTPILAGDFSSYYDGGGFVQTLFTGVNKTRATLQHLKENDWLDERTRALFVEFTVFNPAIQVFSIVVLLFEVTEFGRVHPNAYNIITVKLYNVTSVQDVYIIVLQIVYLGFVVIFTYRLCRAAYRSWYEGKRTRYLMLKYWPNLLIILFTLLCVLVYTIKAFEVKNIMEYAQRNRFTGFVNFHQAAMWNYIYIATGAIATTIVLFNFLRFVVLHPRVLTFYMSLRNASTRLAAVIVFISVGITAFVLSGRLVLGPVCQEFSSLAGTVMMVTYVTIRHLIWWQPAAPCLSTHSLTAATFLIVLTLSVIMVMFPLMQAVLLSSINYKRRKDSHMTTEIELATYRFDHMKVLLGIWKTQMFEKKYQSTYEKLHEVTSEHPQSEGPSQADTD